jgi:hypothetical protein
MAVGPRLGQARAHQPGGGVFGRRYGSVKQIVLIGDIRPADGELLIRLDPLTAPRRTQPWPHSATSSPPPAPATDLVLRYEVKSHLSPA